jgi:hypothetical protein
VVGHTATDATQNWVITNGTVNITILATSPDNVWTTLNDEADEMVASIVILSGGAGQ